MHKLIALVIFTIAALFTMPSSVRAHVTGVWKFVAFESQCAGIGGTLNGTGTGATCTHTVSTPFTQVIQEAGESNQAWTISGTTTETHVTTWVNHFQPLQTAVNPSVMIVTSCLNPGGKEMNLKHSFCKPL